ncbi:MAG: protein kinase [Acidobacteria bacterium]|nr:protein kinase [Acidobacteriota bacterium]
MQLEKGRRLGPYEIQELLGAGGMGEVYRALDTRLSRTVALKTLKAEKAGDEGLRKRFLREAQVASKLAHPNIGTLFDVGEEDGLVYFVMEHLEGETLDARLARGAMPLKEALTLGIQIADGLAAAHAQGVTHRDLKPGNVMLTPQGARILDFGLAKIAQDPARIANASRDTRSLTASGLIVGTLEYMAPEQLEGLDADPRSDVFAFGCVLYEMVSGKKPFPGASMASLIGAVLHVEPPPVSAQREGLPPLLDRAVARCLAKSPGDRWQSVKDLADELRWLLSMLGSGAPATFLGSALSRSAFLRRALPLALAVLLGAAVATVVASRRTGPQPLTEVSLVLPRERPLLPSFANPFALSPDGRTLAYIGRQDGARHVFLQSLSSREAVLVPGSASADGPFFSPDGRFVAFTCDRELRKAPVAGGPAVPIAEMRVAGGAAWLPDDTIVFAADIGTPLSRVSALGSGPSAAKTITKLEAEQRTHRHPQAFPDGRSVVYVAGTAGMTSFDEATLHVLDLASGVSTPTGITASWATPVSSDTLVYARGGELFATRLDPSTRKPLGAAIVVAGNVRTGTSGALYGALSSSGTLLLAPPEGPRARQLVWVDRRGAQTPASQERRSWSYPRLSPDGTRVAVTALETTYDLWLLEPARGSLARLTFGRGHSVRPIWAPDGKRLAFAAYGPGEPAQLWEVPVDGSGPPARLHTAPGHDHRPTGFSPDGTKLLVNEFSVDTVVDVSSLEGGTMSKVVSGPAREHDGTISPDGRRIAYVSNESGRDEVYVRDFPGPGGRVAVSASGGAFPVFSRDGRELFYRFDDAVFAATLREGPPFEVDPPVLLFRQPLVDGAWDVAPDGSRFIMVAPGESERDPMELRLTLGFAAEVERRLAAASAGKR